MQTRESMLVLIRGGGDLGTGAAHRLHRSGLKVVVTELPQPLVIRRKVAFASAIYDGQVEVESVEARVADHEDDVRNLLEQHIVAVIVDPEGHALTQLQPDVVVDARLAKRNMGTTLADAPIVIGLGPGFTAGRDVHAVIETMRGHNLGRVILQGSAQPDTHVPGLVHGYGRERVLWAPRAGRFQSDAQIGQRVQSGETIASVEKHPVQAGISGVLRGLLHKGLSVREGQKVGDIDPRGIREYCFTISDKARAIGGGVLEATLYLRRHLTTLDSSAKLEQERSREDDL